MAIHLLAGLAVQNIAVTAALSAPMGLVGGAVGLGGHDWSSLTVPVEVSGSEERSQNTHGEQPE